MNRRPEQARTYSGRRRPARAGIVAEAVNRLFRFGFMGVGALIMVAGFLIAPLPGPFGLPLAVVGLMIVLRNSMWAKREFVRLKRRHPNWIFPSRRLMRREPEVVPVFWQQVLRLERLLLPKRPRFLGGLRRRFRGRRTTNRR